MTEKKYMTASEFMESKGYTTNIRGSTFTNFKKLDAHFINKEELLDWLKEELEEVEAENIRYGKRNIKDKLCDGASYALRDVIAKVISNSIEEFVDNRNKSKKEILELLK